MSFLGSYRRFNIYSKVSLGFESDGGSYIMSRVSGKRERERDFSLSWMGVFILWVGWVERRDWDFSLSLIGAREREGERDSFEFYRGLYIMSRVSGEREKKERRERF